MIQFFKRSKVKRSHSCTEDLEMEEKETKSVEANTSTFSQKIDHKTSVIFAQDLKKRSEETSTVNPFESLNILLQGKAKMKEYSGTMFLADSTLASSSIFAVKATWRTSRSSLESDHLQPLIFTTKSLYCREL